ncbi:hypothetical protein F5Y19DRAFT_447284 [Xylariaceae sp. FL1651]|nr:hypothetical protein F5Y19DRAFT_447284 [Xylariaceae sp. FL1651]
MEWAADDMTLTSTDMESVFKYSQARTKVVKVLKSQIGMVIEECETDQDWLTLIQERLPLLNGETVESGLTLLIAPRISLNVGSGSLDLPTNCHGNINKESNPRHEHTIWRDSGDPLELGGQRQTRILPFSQTTFALVSKAFYMHRSISRVVNRADVPFFSCEEVVMKDNLGQENWEAWVYNCRSTNAWGGDLALTVTHFPHCGLSFGVLFGCPQFQEQYIIQQLGGAIQGSAHPLLLPGIFAEMEKKRHHQIFESKIDELELTMPETDMGIMSDDQRPQSESSGQNRRAAYLAMLYLKHGLESWSKQLEKMLKHCLTLKSNYFESADRIVDHSYQTGSEKTLYLKPKDLDKLEDSPVGDPRTDTHSSFSDKECESELSHSDSELDMGREARSYHQAMIKTTEKIARRLQFILDEYTDKIRECQMRFDGLTMATQLSQGEASLQLGLATNKDSRHMRTIALVTMVFLPGTFFATLFSMTFFNWQASGGAPVVSPLFWIYVLCSVVATALTLLVWYYYGTIRPKKLRDAALLINDAV